MLPYRQTDTTFAELDAELETLTSGAARFTIDHDQRPFPAAWSDGTARLVVGSVQTSFRGVVVVVELHSDLTPWQFDEQFGEPIAALLRRRLPRQLTWRLQFADPAGPLSLARLGQCRIGEALIRPYQQQEHTMKNSEPQKSLLDELHAFIGALLVNEFDIPLDSSARESIRSQLVQLFLKLRTRTPRIIDDEYVNRLEGRLDAFAYAIESLNAQRPSGPYGKDT